MVESAKTLHLHLVSDATGETTHRLARAALSRFSGVKVEEHVWSLVRTEEQLRAIEESVGANGGVVIFSVAEKNLRARLEEICRVHSVPAANVLDHVVHTLSKAIGKPDSEVAGGQYRMDDAYFNRMDILDFAIQHDDGQGMSTVGEADILLVGVSRSSKTPTSIYLAHRGYRVANYPLVPGVAMPLDQLPPEGLFVVGLVKDPRRLAQIRRNRLQSMNERVDGDYADQGKISEEIASARKLFKSQNWPVINVSRRSVEETAAEIINLHTAWLGGDGG